MKPKLTMSPGKVTYVSNYVVIYEPTFPKDRAEELFTQGFRLVGTTTEPDTTNAEYIFERMTIEPINVKAIGVASPSARGA